MYNKVRGYRNMLKMSQEKLGDYLGITKQTYHLKEVGKLEFKTEEMKKIKELVSEIFPNITIDDIFF
ncbi:helix-turn-helix transcriptional regulator [Granulicatella adiacens]|jgi:putative transcriptional regulator